MVYGGGGFGLASGQVTVGVSIAGKLFGGACNMNESQQHVSGPREKTAFACASVISAPAPSPALGPALGPALRTALGWALETALGAALGTALGCPCALGGVDVRLGAFELSRRVVFPPCMGMLASRRDGTLPCRRRAPLGSSASKKAK